MKKITLLTAILLSSLVFVEAQVKIKEGKIKLQSSKLDSGMSSESVTYFKNGDIRYEMKTDIGNMVVIRRGKSGDSYTLMEMQGRKFAVKTPVKNSATSNKLKITTTSETKMIAGYKCNKIILTMTIKGEEKMIEEWITKEIDKMDIGGLAPSEGVDGFCMEFKLTESGLTMHQWVTSIEKYTVPDSFFQIPDDYKVTTKEEMQNSLKSGQ